MQGRTKILTFEVYYKMDTKKVYKNITRYRNSRYLTEPVIDHFSTLKCRSGYFQNFLFFLKLFCKKYIDYISFTVLQYQHNKIS